MSAQLNRLSLLVTLCLAFSVSWSATAQDLAYEDFETAVLPAGWTHHQGGWDPDNSCYDFHDPGEGSGLFLSLEACAGGWWSQNTGIETDSYDVSVCPSVTVEFGLYNADDEVDWCASSWTDTDPPTGECIGVSTDGVNYDRLEHLTEWQYPAGSRWEVELDATDYTGGSVSFYLAESDDYPYDWDGLLFDDFTVICGETLCDDGIDNDGDGDVDCDDDDCIDGDVDGDGYSPCDGDCDDADASLDPADADGDGYSTCDGDCDDTDDEASNEDADGDGFSTCDGDCDDASMATYPGAEEVCDFADNDCNDLVDDADADADGYAPIDCGGEDCDDEDPAVNPDAEEICDDGIDNDCNGLADDESVCEAGDDDDSAESDTCECRADGGYGSAAANVAMLLGLVGVMVRRRR